MEKWTGVQSYTEVRAWPMQASTPMVDLRRLQLALRVILGSTRAAVSSHRRYGQAQMIRPAVERGLSLMDELGARLPDDSPPEIRSRYESARAELVALDGTPESQPSAVRDDRTLPEEIHVRP